MFDFPEFLDRLRNFRIQTGAIFFVQVDDSIKQIEDPELDPLTALCNYECDTNFGDEDVIEAGDVFGLPRGLTHEIVDAMTSTDANPQMRNRILEACGLPSEEAVPVIPSTVRMVVERVSRRSRVKTAMAN